MTLGLVGAIPEEIDLLRQQLVLRASVTVGQRDYLSGTLQGRDVVLVFSRIGKVAAASTVTTLLERFGVGQIVFTGVAGAANPLLNIGDVVVADALIQHDMDASALPMFRRFEIPLLGQTHFRVDPGLGAQLAQAARAYVEQGLPGITAEDGLAFGLHAPRVVQGLVASGDQFMADTFRLMELRRNLPELQCVEMEGAAVAQVCHEHGVPFGVVRTISDKADHSAAVDFPKFAARVAAPFSAGIIGEWLKHSGPGL